MATNVSNAGVGQVVGQGVGDVVAVAAQASGQGDAS